MENIYMLVNVVEFKRYQSLDFPTMLFFIPGAKSENILRGYVAFKGTPSKKYFFLIL